nr:vegetative cell wall protein gp1-like [Aegilops tauschii subsp. strangulata]
MTLTAPAHFPHACSPRSWPRPECPPGRAHRSLDAPRCAPAVAAAFCPPVAARATAPASARHCCCCTAPPARARPRVAAPSAPPCRVPRPHRPRPHAACGHASCSSTLVARGSSAPLEPLVSRLVAPSSATSAPHCQSSAPSAAAGPRGLGPRRRLGPPRWRLPSPDAHGAEATVTFPSLAGSPPRRRRVNVLFLNPHCLDATAPWCGPGISSSSPAPATSARASPTGVRTRVHDPDRARPLPPCALPCSWPRPERPPPAVHTAPWKRPSARPPAAAPLPAHARAHRWLRRLLALPPRSAQLPLLKPPRPPPLATAAAALLRPHAHVPASPRPLLPLPRASTASVAHARRLWPRLLLLDAGRPRILPAPGAPR